MSDSLQDQICRNSYLTVFTYPELSNHKATLTTHIDEGPIMTGTIAWANTQNQLSRAPAIYANLINAVTNVIPFFILMFGVVYDHPLLVPTKHTFQISMREISFMEQLVTTFQKIAYSKIQFCSFTLALKQSPFWSPGNFSRSLRFLFPNIFFFGYAFGNSLTLESALVS